MCVRAFLFLAFAVGVSGPAQAQSRFFFGRINSIIDAFARITATQAQSQSRSRMFLGQVSAILAAGDDHHFSGIKGKLLNTAGTGQKAYECTLPLDGFTTMLLENGAALPAVTATSVSYAAAYANVQYLLNDIVRDQDGLPGYINHKNATEHFTDYGKNDEAITMLAKNGSDVRLVIYKLRNQAGYILIVK